MASAAPATERVVKQTDHEHYLSIGKAARELGVSIDTLRRWDKRGLVHPVRLNGKNRLFAKQEIEQLKATRPVRTSAAAKQLGVSISTLRRLEKKSGVVPPRNTQAQRQYTPQLLQRYASVRHRRLPTIVVPIRFHQQLGQPKVASQATARAVRARQAPGIKTIAGQKVPRALGLSAEQILSAEVVPPARSLPANPLTQWLRAVRQHQVEHYEHSVASLLLPLLAIPVMLLLAVSVILWSQPPRGGVVPEPGSTASTSAVSYPAVREWLATQQWTDLLP